MRRGSAIMVRMRTAVLVLVLAGCLDDDLVRCEDGRACPFGRACDIAHHGCVAPEQLTACAGIADFEACAAPGVTGRCFDGVCLAAGCGNGFVEPEELCDDGNTLRGDGCASDCLSR